MKTPQLKTERLYLRSVKKKMLMKFLKVGSKMKEFPGICYGMLVMIEKMPGTLLKKKSNKSIVILGIVGSLFYKKQGKS